MTLLLVALGAAVGAPLRFLAGHHLDGRLPWGTLVANVLGSALLGTAAGLGLGGSPWALVGVGFCGGLTTYSAFAVKVHEHGPRHGLTYASTTLLLAMVAVAAGFAVGRAL
ncbi:MAG: CrcB family protein [Nocardioides sp.]